LTRADVRLSARTLLAHDVGEALRFFVTCSASRYATTHA
jgi:hypothetical protein